MIISSIINGKNLRFKNKILKILDNNKAIDVVSIELGKSTIADYMIVASGTLQDTYKPHRTGTWTI